MARILIVEDSPAMRGLIASIVEELADSELGAGGAVEVVEVGGGFEALRQLPGTTFDLIITDINMPDINGLELLSYIRKNPLHEKTPVLIVTSEESVAQRERGLALGANAVLCKPFSKEQLLAAVKELL